MALTTTGSPFSLNIPSASSDLADLFGSYLVPNMTAVNTYAAHKATAQTFSALQTFSAGLNVTSGNVGIGTSSPQANLHVTSVGFNVGYFTNGTFASSSNSTLLIGGGDAGLGGWENVFLAIHKYGSTAGIGSSSSLSRIRFDATSVMMTTDNGSSVLWAGSGGTYSGNVGIGTSSPAQLLEVQSAAAYILVNSTNTAYSGGYYISSNSVEKWHITNEPGGAHGLYIRDAANDTGVSLAQDTTAWVTASDFRLKDVKETIANALDKVNQLTGVKFTWKRDADKPDAKTRVGLIAQDVLSVLPEAVSDDTPDIITDEETGKVSGGLGVRYTELVPLLVNAIKELAQRVEALEA